MEYDEFFAMNTSVLCAAQGSPSSLAAGFAAVRAWVAQCEARFSRFRADSELCRLNRAAGSWFLASVDLYRLVETALDLHAQTGGLFDPSVLPALQQAGYDRSMEIIQGTGGRAAAPVACAAAPAGRFAETVLDPARWAIRLPEHVQIDLGGLAKGWIAERAAQLLAAYSPVCAVDAGGDMVLVGAPDAGVPESGAEASPCPPANAPAGCQGPAWRVALEDPRNPQQILAILQVRPGALVTSSITRRRWSQQGQPRHHIIDPRTGFPAQPAWLSVTVSAPSAVWAEAFAKAILLAGPDAAPHLARRLPALRFLAVNPDGSLWVTSENMEMLDVPEFIH